MQPGEGAARRTAARRPASEDARIGPDRRALAPPAHAARVTRVLMTADAVGGVWSYALDLSTALRARGVDVTLATMGPPPRARQRAAAASCGVPVAVEPWRLEWMEDPWEDVQRAGEWLLNLERRCAPDVVHLNGYCHAVLPWRAPVLVAGHSCVRSWWRAVHGSAPPPRWDRYSREVARGLSAAAIVVAPTDAMLAALHQEYGTIRASRVIANGRRPPGEGRVRPVGKEPIVFSAGRLWDAAKNIDALCAVASALPWPVYVAGDTQAPEGVRAPSAGVRCLGRLEGPELDGWFARAAVYVLPARYEPFGLSVLEAALAGCALVLGDISSLRENWSGAAIFVPPDDRHALASAIRRVIDDPDERGRLANRARGRAEQFTVDRMAHEYLTLYHDLVEPAFPVGRAADRPSAVGAPP